MNTPRILKIQFKILYGQNHGHRRSQCTENLWIVGKSRLLALTPCCSKLPFRTLCHPTNEAFFHSFRIHPFDYRHLFFFFALLSAISFTLSYAFPSSSVSFVFQPLFNRLAHSRTPFPCHFNIFNLTHQTRMEHSGKTAAAFPVSLSQIQRSRNNRQQKNVFFYSALLFTIAAMVTLVYMPLINLLYLAFIFARPIVDKFCKPFLIRKEQPVFPILLSHILLSGFPAR